MKKILLYFGCIRNAGHYLWMNERQYLWNARELQRAYGIALSDRFVECIDGLFCPAGGHQGQYQVSYVPPFCIVAWHDFTVDSRPGSNSALLGAGYDGTGFTLMIQDAKQQFPTVMARQTILVPYDPSPRPA